MGFGNTLSNLLKSKNMTVAELAKKTGISSSTLYAIIRRDSDNVNLSAIQKIAHELNVSVETLQAVDKVSAGIIPSTTFLHIAILLSKILKNSRFPVF